MVIKKIFFSVFFLSIPIFCFSQLKEISEDSLTRYFNKLNEKNRFEKKNIDFMMQKNTSSKTIIFKFLLQNEMQIDNAVNQKGYIQPYIDFTIAAEEIDPKLWDKNMNAITENPDWNYIKKNIKKKYPESYAERTVLGAQIRWYEYKKDTTELIKYNVQKIEKYGIDTLGFGRANFNNMIYTLLFMHTSDLTLLNKAIDWMESVLEVEPDTPNFIDTYANLLYKTGRKKEALKWETKALILEPENEETKEVINKMQKNEPTWPNIN